MIKLAQSPDGRLIIASNQEFPSDVSRVEYFRDLKLFMLTFECGEDALMPAEVSNDVALIIHNSPDIIVIAMKEEGKEPYGYVVPLVQIGV